MTIEPTIPTSSPGAGALLRLIRDGQASTRAELVALTGLARSTVAQRMDALLAQRLVVPAGGSVSTGGRPPQMFAFNRDAGVVLAADLGATHSRARGHRPRRRRPRRGRRGHRDRRRPRGGPGLARAKRSTRCSTRSAAAHADVRGVGVGVPGPVEFATGTPVAPPIMPGWDGYRVARPAGRPLRRADARRQRREHHGAGRALEGLARLRPPALRQGRHRHRLRDHHRRPDPPRRPGRGRRHRPHPRARATRRSAAAATAAASRRSPAAARWPRGCAPRASRRRTRATSCATCATGGPRRCSSCARPAASSARCSPRRSTSSTRA